jgi:glutamate-1-semialdehyde aminotransferase
MPAVIANAHTPIDTELRARAQRVTPGGMTGYLNAAYLAPGYPQLFQRAEGCRLWDADGRESTSSF